MQKQKISDVRKVAAILLAVFGLGWAGALLVKSRHWIGLLVLWLIGIVTAIILIGFLLLFIAWIWGLVVTISDN